MISRRTTLAAIGSRLWAAPARSRIAITLDDVNWRDIPAPYQQRADERLLGALGTVQAALFAVGRHVDNPEGQAVLGRWSGAGHVIGNHTYSHLPLNRTPVDQFEHDILRNEPILREHSRFQRWFRFPQLKEGTSLEVRDRVRAFLKEHGYQNAPVTIDASDWYFDMRLRQKLQSDPGFDPARIRTAYLEHIRDRSHYYDGLARELTSRPVAHVLLLHYNLINVLFLSDVLRMLRGEGWDICGVNDAFADPIYGHVPNTIPAGESLVWAMAKETGRFRLRYPAEDGPYEKERVDEALR